MRFNQTMTLCKFQLDKEGDQQEAKIPTGLCLLLMVTDIQFKCESQLLLSDTIINDGVQRIKKTHQMHMYNM